MAATSPLSDGEEPKLIVLYEDDALIAVDKPARLASVASPGATGATCASELQRSHPEALPVHRLDRETSGVLLFAKGPEALEACISLFRERKVLKHYLALLRGAPRLDEGTIRLPIARDGKQAVVARHGQEAETLWRVVERFRYACLVDAQPVTGRYNQIRLHFASIELPLVGERKYARGKKDPIRFRRVALHARSLDLPHPSTGAPVHVEAPLPRDLVDLLERLRGE